MMRILTILMIASCVIGVFSLRKKTYFTTWHIGAGSGSLNLANMASTYGIQAGDVVIINAGTYSGGSLTNSRFASMVTVRASDSGVTLTGTFDFTNNKNITLDKFHFFNITGRGLNLTTSDTCTIQNSYFYNVSDYMIHFDGTAGSYDGTHSTRFDDIRLVRDTFRVSGPSDNMVAYNGGRSVNKNLYIGYCLFDSSFGNTSTCLALNSHSYNTIIEYNTFSKMNLGGVDHNAVVYWQGYGYFRYNLCIGRHGDLIRCRPYWLDSSATHNTPDTTFVYGNRDVSSMKYAFIEMQHKGVDTTTNTDLPNVRTGILYCFNNTTLNGRTSDYFPFQTNNGGGSGLADVYDWRRKPIFKNNLVGRQYMDSVPNPNSPPAGYTFNYIFHDGGGGKPAGMPVFGDTSNNIYRHNVADLGISDSLTMVISPTSIAQGAGATAVPYSYDVVGVGTYSVMPVGALVGIAQSNVTRQEKRKNILIISR